ncbi:MAG: sulfotransferase [Pseudomonadota bacterium]
MSEYGFSSRLLHRLALGVPALAEATFDAETSALKNGPGPDLSKRHVFVSGLARSGTTVLMRALYETGEFASLTYRDMPFVLAPGIWAKLTARGAVKGERTERAHGDGLDVDFDSPEALEEPFWRIFCGDDYIKSDRLCAMDADDEVIENFRFYIEAVLQRYQSQRYLSKNNNNILRYDSIIDAFPNARIIAPFRDPLAQAASLLTQHRRFCDRHAKDPFDAKYMTWLVHHEFGADHRPFEWGVAAAGRRDVNALDYWLAQWIGVYTHLLAKAEKHPENVLLHSYEDLCENTSDSWRRVADFVGVNAPAPAGLKRATRTPDDAYDPALLNEATALYNDLTRRARAR